MPLNNVAREQQIAVFGAAGSGKTVLLSSFYGAAVEHQISGTDRFDVVAEDAGQRTSLYQNYLGMKKSGLARVLTPDCGHGVIWVMPLR
ncbi:hypothetical protein [Frondihabitans sp. PAMC 28766]|uniref:hypothetical protein n=1 Tax=Frondihabitans sp. PAMC 28766 TaxID=1795630 RepID=UPI0009E85C9A|nr:hypothetical protein [Frondihabitans sp. PAMC 28766]